MKNITFLGKMFLTIGYLFLYVPIIVLVIYSFNSSKISALWGQFSFEWYNELFQNKILIDAAITSFKIAFISSTLSLIIGYLSALVIEKSLFWRMAFKMPLVIPEIIIAITILLFFITIQNGFSIYGIRGLWSVVVGHVTISFSYTSTIIRSRLKNLDKSIEEAACDLGAKPICVFWNITIPQMYHAMLASWLLSFAVSFDDVVLASFLSGPKTTTLPVLIFSNIKMGISPEINALTSMILFTILIIIFIYFIKTFKKRKKL